MTDKRIAKASHPTIYAWRCIVDEKIKQGKRGCRCYLKMDTYTDTNY